MMKSSNQGFDGRGRMPGCGPQRASGGGVVGGELPTRHRPGGPGRGRLTGGVVEAGPGELPTRP